MSPRRVLETIVREHAQGRCTALCAIVATRGSTPQPAGVLVCVDEAAHMIGTLGGGCVEADVRRRAHQQLSKAHAALLTFKLDADFGYDDGMICGGQLDIAVCPIAPEHNITPFRDALAALETGVAVVPVQVQSDDQTMMYRIHIEPTPKLFIAGAGHISRVLAEVAQRIGFEIHVLDDRVEYANERRFPTPIIVHVGDIANILRQDGLTDGAYIVIVTRGHRHDEAALGAVLTSRARYIGMIGSRRKIKVIFDDLRHDGADQTAIEKVHAPIGLPIGAVTTNEIAISIAAELINVRRANHQRVVEGPYPVPPS